MAENHVYPIRYHFPNDFTLSSDEAVFLHTLDDDMKSWERRIPVPEASKSPIALQAFLRREAFRLGGHGWRAETERGEILCSFSVSDRAKESRGNGDGPLRFRDDWLALAVARAEFGIS